ncbi:Chaperone DnaJ-domain superfamily protein [Forsythia ovata]|uniref:Chaperone DnaJ-domain superfamily protein n=1 Tax=Forsythia ovata TaxID=205694 RepID=A0ABD1VDG1_9LAMI
MMWDEFYDYFQHHNEEESEGDNNINFESASVLSKPKDYYKILEVDYDATEEVIRSNFIRLALKWHPDKQKDVDSTTSRFQEINEAYQVLSDPVQRREYDKRGMLYAYDNNVIEYLHRYKGLILTSNGLGMKCSIW